MVRFLFFQVTPAILMGANGLPLPFCEGVPLSDQPKGCSFHLGHWAGERLQALPFRWPASWASRPCVERRPEGWHAYGSFCVPVLVFVPFFLTLATYGEARVCCCCSFLVGRRLITGISLVTMSCGWESQLGIAYPSSFASTESATL